MTLVLPILLLGSVHADATLTAKLIATLQGKKVGTATYTRKVLEDKSWVETMNSKLETNGATLVSDFRVHFSAEGQCIDEEEKEAVDDVVRESLLVKFTKESATVTDRLTGESKSFPTPSSPSFLDPSDRWFVKTKPKIGDKGVASSFSTEDGWRTTTVTYVSDRSFKLGDETIQGHVIKHENPKDSHLELVDDDGMPLEIEVPGADGMKFTRSPYTDL